MKIHLCRILWPVKLNFEELSTVLSQVEACTNSRLLVALPPDDDGVEALTPGYFLIASKAHPNKPFSYTSISLLCRFQLCQLSPRSSHLEALVD